MAGNEYDYGRGGAPRQGRGQAPQPYGGGAPGASPAPPPGGFGNYRREQPAEPYGDQPAGEPEYFGARPAPGARPSKPHPAYDDNPGHTRAFSVDQDAYANGGPGYTSPNPDHVAVYRAGGQVGPHTTQRPLRWRELLTGMYLNPSRTFERMRDHQVWLPALTISLLYGVLAVFGFGDTRSDVLDSNFTIALWTVVGTAIGFTVVAVTLGAVTHTVARRLGGDGIWQPTIGLSALIAWTTDVPRLLFALVLPADGAFVQLLGWASWLLCAGLLTTMVRRVHDLPWGKAAGAAAIQLIILLILIKLPTLS